MECTSIADGVGRTGQQWKFSVDETQDLTSETTKLASDLLVQIHGKKIQKKTDRMHGMKKLEERMAKLENERRRLRKKIKKLEAEFRRMREENAKRETLLEALSRDKGISASKVKSGVELVESFLEQLDANVKSQVDYSDFKILEKDLRKDLRMVGRFNVPLSLAPISERIYDTYGDITSESSQSDCAAMPSYFLFCAAIQEMDDLKLEQVNKTKMLLWRDAINSALNVQFKVDFAKKQLKKIARAYFGLKAMEEINNEKLKNIDGTVKKIELPENCLCGAIYFGGNEELKNIDRTVRKIEVPEYRLPEAKYIWGSEGIDIEEFKNIDGTVSKIEMPEDCLPEAQYFWGKEEIDIEEFKNIDGTVSKIEVPEDCLREAKYFWGKEEINNEELKNIDGTVRKKKVLEDCLCEAKYFWGKPLSTGLFY
ncbi:uncharacterized protein LOC111290786 [Durio zibethinus]|uniref:Uncharacterized protein LOC111290786 n=1 Tax=Durio zibethinus TaxID=66656 RepID=A0A6P5YBU8_DURZI|nr:uncharacterized protein LOC111290786 [Durio zibethinus]XP_022737990.1 uncharacterized protein LOC111290786 [Durio zibethinus]XP_022737991.1 uncharacterized protein LOC111290786 [Durio zibethinus]